MERLTEQMLAHAERLPERAPLATKGLLHLGNRAGVDQALSRLAERGQLIRAGRGVYLFALFWPLVRNEPQTVQLGSSHSSDWINTSSSWRVSYSLILGQISGK